VNALRARQQRNFLATLLLSQGAPMLLGGDEFGRTQHGNNNAWCQDNEMSWFDWESVDEELLEYVRRLIRLRREHPVFRLSAFLTGTSTRGSGLPDVWWFRPDSRRMTQRDWQHHGGHTLGVFLNGREIASRTPHGEVIADDSFLLLFNASPETVEFTLPARRFGSAWTVELATGAVARRATLSRVRRSACRTGRSCCCGARRLPRCGSTSPARSSRRTSATSSARAPRGCARKASTSSSRTRRHSRSTTRRRT
jgi:Type II secretory pathway, pullulanase PulA and related glycosidases